jgi:hypothetical protein
VAIIRVKADGDDTDGTTWAKAVNAIDDVKITSAATGSIIWVDTAHDEIVSGNHSVDFVNGTIVSPIRIVSVDSSDDSYASRGARHGGSTSFTISGNVEFYGLQLDSGSGDMFIFNNSTENQIYDDCDLKVGTASADDLIIGGNDSEGVIRNSTIHLWDQILNNGNDGTAIEFYNCIFDNDGASTALFVNGELHNRYKFQGCDLSGWTSIVGTPEKGAEFWVCESVVGSSFTMMSGSAAEGMHLLLERSKNGNDATILGLQEQVTFEGVIKGDLARYRTGGADDGAAGAHSWEMVANTNTLEFYRPLASPWAVRWVAGGSEITLTFYVASGGTLNDDDFWVELFSPDETATSTQQADYRTSAMASPQATPAALTTDSASTWNGSGVGTKQEIAFTFTPDQAGPVKFRACLARAAGVTVYFDPKCVVS